MSSAYIDYFKLFKVLDLKKLDKHGDVKLTQDKHLSRKVLFVDGQVSTQNYITFQTCIIPNLSFQQRYLYVLGLVQPSKNFCFDVSMQLNSKSYKILFSTLYKSAKSNQQKSIQLPLDLKSSKWTIMVVDLHEICEKYYSNETRMSFRLESITIRANSKVKGIYQSDTLFDPFTIPKEMSFHKTKEDFYSQYNYVICGEKEKAPKIIEEQKNIKEEVQVKKEEMPMQKEEIKKEKIQRRKQKIQKKKPSKKVQPEFMEVEEEIGEQEEKPRINFLPKPKPTLSAKLIAVEGSTITKGNITSIGSFIVSPVMFPVHKSIKCIFKSNFRLVVGYDDGSICVWHSIKKTPLLYFKTELSEIKLMKLIEENLFLVGFDKMRREVITIINGEEMLFKQISNYSIQGFQVLDDVILTYGYENIRIWKIIPEKSLITGTSLYLGKMNQKNHYTDSCLVPSSIAFVTDSNGYITKISLEEGKMLTMHKVDDNGLDHIIYKNGEVLIASKIGLIRILNTQLQCLMEMEIGARIKKLQWQGDELRMTHCNKSVSLLNLQTSEFNYVQRCHTGRVVGLGYSKKQNKIVSISEDQTVRIWSLSINCLKNAQLPFMIKQQYEFVVKARNPACLTVDSGNFAYVGFENGEIKKIDINNYKLVKEENINEKLSGIDISKNGKRILLIHLDQEWTVSLSDNQLSILSQFKLEFEGKVERVVTCFNQTMKKLLICWVQKQKSKIQAFSLQNQLVCEFYVSMKPNRADYADERILLYSKEEMQVYNEEGEMKALFSVPSTYANFPLFFKSQRQKLEVGIVSHKQKQFMDMPQIVQNMVEIQVEDHRVVLCSGKESFSLYAVCLEARNLEDVLIKLQAQNQEISEEEQIRETAMEKLEQCEQEEEMEDNEFMETVKPKQLRKLYEEQEKMFQLCKEALIPSEPEKKQTYQQVYEVEKVNQPKGEGIRVSLFYGWETQYCKQSRQHLIWLPALQSALLLVDKTLVLHKFGIPVQQMHARLPMKPSLILEDRSLILVALGNQIRVYNHQLVNIRCIGNVSGDKVDGMAMSGCEGYVIVLSSNKKMLYVQVIDIHTQKVISSSYMLKGDVGIPVKILINPHKSGLEFVIATRSKLLFYRLTSILTLQYQSLEKIQQTTKVVGEITSISYCLEEILLIGLSEGSILVVDGRSATVLLLIKHVLKCPVMDILVESQSLVIVGEGMSSLTLLSMEESSLEEIVNCLSCSEKKGKNITTDSQIHSHSKIQILSEGKLGMLVMTKFGVLWLVDLGDGQTIKVSSIHRGQVTKCLSKGDTLISGGKDGNVFETSLKNLEQSAEIYKPRKSVKDMIYNSEKNILLVAFNNQLYFYGQNYSYLGTVQMESVIWALCWIQSSDNYVILTEKQIFLLHHLSSQTKRFKVQLKEVSEVEGSLIKPKLKTYQQTHLLLIENNKVNVWVKKKIRTGGKTLSPLQQFTQTVYYLMDSYLGKEPFIGVHFLSESEYISCRKEYTRTLLEWRDFNEHSILKSLELDICEPTMMYIDEGIYIGDDGGLLWLVNENGLTVSKVRVFDNSIEGMEKIEEGRAAVYGHGVGIVEL